MLRSARELERCRASTSLCSALTWARGRESIHSKQRIDSLLHCIDVEPDAGTRHRMRRVVPVRLVVPQHVRRALAQSQHVSRSPENEKARLSLTQLRFCVANEGPIDLIGSSLFVFGSCANELSPSEQIGVHLHR
jgi:hypothetical protein